MMRDADRSWIILANAACNGTLTPDSRRRLQALLRDDTTARRRFVAYMDMHAAIAWDLRADDAVPAFATASPPQTAQQEDTAALLREILEQEQAAAEQRAHQERERQMRESREAAERRQWLQPPANGDAPKPVRHIVIPRSIFLGLVGSVAAAILLCIWLALPHGPQRATPAPPQQTIVAAPPAPLPVATLHSSYHAKWGEHDLAPGRPIIPGDYRLERGLALVKLNGGATTLLQAPVDFSLVDDASVRLTRGKIVGRCEKGDRLTIHAPNAEVVDLGTEFGVAVGNDGVTTTHVFEGVVRMTPMANGRPGAAAQLVGAGGAREIDATGTRVSTIAAAELAFVRPREFQARRAAETSPYHRWLAYSYDLRRRPDVVAYYTFDDVVSAGALLNRADATAGRLHGIPCDTMLLSLPDRLAEGRFPGKTAMRFHAALNDHILVHDEQMLAHCDTVTVAAWVKPDWSSRFDMTILSRRESHEGAINYQMALLGVVDSEHGSLQWLSRPEGMNLQAPQWMTPPAFPFDSRWMHVVASHGPDASIVYLDGREVARFDYRAVPRMPLPLLIGAAQHGSNAEDIQPRFYFDGVIDELLIVNRAMTASQVQELYQRTRPEP